MARTTSKEKHKKSITFRVDGDILDRLEEHSKQHEISLNALVNRVFFDYLEWEGAQAHVNWFLITKHETAIILDRLDDNTVEEIGKEMGKNTKHIRMLMHGEDSIEAFYNILYQRMKRSGFYVQKTISGNKTRIYIKHDFGVKLSKYLCALYGEILDGFGRKSTLEYTDNDLVIDIND